MSADELLGLRAPKLERLGDSAETRRLWKRFQLLTRLPEKDQRTVIRPINSLVSLSTKQRNLRAAG